MCTDLGDLCILLSSTDKDLKLVTINYVYYFENFMMCLLIFITTVNISARCCIFEQWFFKHWMDSFLLYEGIAPSGGADILMDLLSIGTPPIQSSTTIESVTSNQGNNFLSTEMLNNMVILFIIILTLVFKMLHLFFFRNFTNHQICSQHRSSNRFVGRINHKWFSTR